MQERYQPGSVLGAGSRSILDEQKNACAEKAAPRDIPSAVDVVHAELEEAGRLFEIIEVRLEGLRQSSPQPTTDQACRSGHCKLSSDIYTAADRVSYLNAKMRNLLAELQV